VHEPKFLRVRNWERYQVYQDGRPMNFFAIHVQSDPKKGRVGIFDDPAFLSLADDEECPVFRMMAYAAVTGNKIPNSPEFLKAKLFTERPVNIRKMIDAGFLESWVENPSTERVYFVRAAQGIKIGYTANLKERHRMLGGELLGSVPGDRDRERELHLLFADDKIHGEWFKESPSLQEFIRVHLERTELPANGSIREEKREEEKEQDAANSAAIQTVYDHWRVKLGKTDARYANRITPNRRKKIAARLREFTSEELIRAIDGVALDPWQDRPRHNDLTIVFRTQEQVEKFIDLASGSSVKSAHPCARCGMGFRTSALLNDHMENVHHVWEAA
jgi:hypothetical protein